MYSKRRGNILFLILLAVVLFAALSYAVTQSLRGGGSNANAEKGAVKAADVVNYFTNIRMAVQRIRLVNQCSDIQISFDHNNGAAQCLTSETPATNHENPNSPTNCTCHVFHPLGGGVPYRDRASFAFPGVSSNYTQNYGVGRSSIPNLGTAAAELYTSFYPFTDIGAPTEAMDDFCEAYNKLVGATSLNVTDSYASVWADPPFVGTFDTGYPADPPFNGLPAACHRYGSAGYYQIYFTLWER